MTDAPKFTREELIELADVYGRHVKAVREAASVGDHDAANLAAYALTLLDELGRNLNEIRVLDNDKHTLECALQSERERAERAEQERDEAEEAIRAIKPTLRYVSGCHPSDGRHAEDCLIPKREAWLDLLAVRRALERNGEG